MSIVVRPTGARASVLGRLRLSMVDRGVARRVRGSLERNRRGRAVGGLHVFTRSRRVWIYGIIMSGEERDEIVRTVAATRGVRQVIDRLQDVVVPKTGARPLSLSAARRS